MVQSQQHHHHPKINQETTHLHTNTGNSQHVCTKTTHLRKYTTPPGRHLSHTPFNMQKTHLRSDIHIESTNLCQEHNSKDAEKNLDTWCIMGIQPTGTHRLGSQTVPESTERTAACSRNAENHKWSQTRAGDTAPLTMPSTLGVELEPNTHTRQQPPKLQTRMLNTSVFILEAKQQHSSRPQIYRKGVSCALWPLPPSGLPFLGLSVHPGGG